MYNRWLVDFCSVEPERHAGMCHVPIWDMDASIAEVVWAHEHGLQGGELPRSLVGAAVLRRSGLGTLLRGVRRARHGAGHPHRRRRTESLRRLQAPGVLTHLHDGEPVAGSAGDLAADLHGCVRPAPEPEVGPDRASWIVVGSHGEGHGRGLLQSDDPSRARVHREEAERVHGGERLHGSELPVAPRSGDGGHERLRPSLPVGFRLSPSRGHVALHARTRTTRRSRGCRWRTRSTICRSRRSVR